MILEQRRKNKKILLVIVLVIALCGLALLFAPKTKTVDPAWETFSDPTTGISFQYPKEFNTTYIHAFDWPPRIISTNETYSCKNAGQEIARVGKTEERTVRGTRYCVTELVEGAAGSTYTEYTYTLKKDVRLLTLTFNIRAPQCFNYDDPQKTECLVERESFALDPLIDKIAQTITLQ